jgi:Ca2+-binding RTX toxin-like protein
MANFTGTTGDDRLKGTVGDDSFDVSQGGDDTVSGGPGNDAFFFGATFNAADHVSGGVEPPYSGADAVYLDGDYSTGVAFAANTLTNIDGIHVAAGHDYRLTELANVSGRFTIDASNLGMSDHLTVDATARADVLVATGGAGADRLTGGDAGDRLDGRDGNNTLYGGGGDDTLQAGAGVDVMNGGEGSDSFGFEDRFSAGDRVKGGPGDGVDSLFLAGGSQSLVLHAATIHGIEVINVSDGTYHLTLDDANVAAGEQMTVNGSPNGVLGLDGSHETDGHLVLVGDLGLDTLTGGAQADTLDGGAGGDLLKGGEGADTFLYHIRGDSVPRAPDLILDLTNDVRIDVHAVDADSTQAHDQDFHLVAQFGGHAGELMVSFDPDRGVTVFAGDSDGDGRANFVIEAQGDHQDFSNFVL